MIHERTITDRTLLSLFLYQFLVKSWSAVLLLLILLFPEHGSSCVRVRSYFAHGNMESVRKWLVMWWFCRQTFTRHSVKHSCSFQSSRYWNSGCQSCFINWKKYLEPSVSKNKYLLVHFLLSTLKQNAGIISCMGDCTFDTYILRTCQ